MERLYKNRPKVEETQNEGFSKPNPNVVLEPYLFFLNLDAKKKKKKKSK